MSMSEEWAKSTKGYVFKFKDLGEWVLMKREGFYDGK